MSGQLQGKVSSIRCKTGQDSLGLWREIDARTPSQVASVRVYSSFPIILFGDKRLSSGVNAGAFPSFHSFPSDLLKFSYSVDNFSTYEFGNLGSEGPWVLFNKKRDVMVISPADHFLVSDMKDDPESVDVAGIDPKIKILPKGFEHKTLILFGTGINRTMDRWGDALQILSGKKPVPNDADVVLNKFGYWTDHFTAYYYRYNKNLGYLGTLLAVRAKYSELHVPIAYMQLDSWWYPKESGFDPDGTPINGEMVYRADPKFFPNGLDGFHRIISLPFIVHARWVAPDSPYRREYKMSSNVILSEKFWKKTAEYLHRSGVVVYEQDWLDGNARPAINLTDPQIFLTNMAHTMSEQGLAIQYCMPLPGYFLASTRYQNLETIRVSDDGFKRSLWDNFLYGSALARAVGLWPWSDAYMSRELPELILDTLSAGPIGVGDPMDQIDARNLKMTMRPDSVLLKPDVSIVPVDATYLSDALGLQAPMVAATHSGDEVEVFAYPRKMNEKQVRISLDELGIHCAAYVLDWTRHVGHQVPDGGSFIMPFRDGWSYDVVAPIHGDGIGLLGDISKIVPLASKRFPLVSYNQGGLIKVAFANGENTVTFTGYSVTCPAAQVQYGSLGRLSCDMSTHLFEVPVHPGANGRLAEFSLDLQK